MRYARRCRFTSLAVAVTSLMAVASLWAVAALITSGRQATGPVNRLTTTEQVNNRVVAETGNAGVGPVEARTMTQDPEVPYDYRRGGRGSYRGGRSFAPTNFPKWEIDPEFKNDVFTFVRIDYTSESGDGQYGYYGRRYERWRIDWPDSDNNFSYRLHELTALKVNPEPAIVRFDGQEIYNYPWVYLVEPGHMSLTQPEVDGMRRYLLRGGFLMVDDFWGEREYAGLARNLKRVFPDRQPVELPIEHEIFHMVYDVNEKPIIPSINHYLRGDWTERDDATEAHFRGVFDDNGRLMIIICHNTDLGDGWEREGVDEGYFRKYSEPYAYPLGINIVVYAMTH